MSSLTQQRQILLAEQADQRRAYQQVIQLLGEMRAIGGDRVSRAIESS